MNILMLHPHDIFSSAEPWTVRIVYIAKEFVKKGHSVKLIYFPLSQDDLKSFELQKGITVIPLSRRLGLVVLFSNIIRVYKVSEWASVIHFQKCFYHAAIPALAASFLRNKPIHYDWDDWELKIYEVSTRFGIIRNLIWFFLGFLENIIPKIVDTISVASLRLKVKCLNLGIKEDIIFEAHCGVDIDKFNPNCSGANIRQKYGIGNFLVLYLGQLHGGQYVELFIQAAYELVNKHSRSDVSFMIIGDGYMRDELKKKTSGLGLNQKVIFTGSISHDLVPEYIAAADVCVACFENNEVTMCKSPLKIVEYMGMGKAIVASNVGETARMLDQSAILVEPGNYNKIAEGILKLINNPGLRQELGIKARERARNIYNWGATSNNLINAYNYSLIANESNIYNQRRV